MSNSIDDLPGVSTLQELLVRLRGGLVLRQPILVEIDDGTGHDNVEAERTMSVQVPRAGDGDLPPELARCQFRVVGRKRSVDRAATAFTVGRARTCDVVIASYSVSKLHATIAHDAERDVFVVTDEGSRNGTRIDGNPVDPAGGSALYAGAKISFGDVSFVFLDPPTLRKLARLSP